MSDRRAPVWPRPAPPPAKLAQVLAGHVEQLERLSFLARSCRDQQDRLAVAQRARTVAARLEAELGELLGPGTDGRFLRPTLEWARGYAEASRS